MFSKKESPKKNKILIFILCLFLAVFVTFIFIKEKGKQHTMAIYVTKGMYIPSHQYKKIVEEEEPVLTEKDIVGYNENTHMMFLSEPILKKYLEDKKTEKPFSLRGGSLILNAQYGDSFILTVDGKPVYGGHFVAPMTASSLPKGHLIKDTDQGVCILKEDFGNTKDLRSAPAFIEALRDMNLLTDRVFDVGVFDGKNKTYSTKNLWEHRTEFVGDSAMVGGLISQLVFPKEIELSAFEIISKSKPYGLVIKLKTNLKTKNHYGDIGNQKNFQQNALMLFALIKNLEHITFSLDDGESAPLDIFYENDMANYTLGENYFEKIKTLNEFYDKMTHVTFFGEEEKKSLKNKKEKTVEKGKEPYLYVWKNEKGKAAYTFFEEENREGGEKAIYEAEYTTDFDKILDRLSLYGHGTTLHIIQMDQKGFSKEEMSRLADRIMEKKILKNSVVTVGLYKKSDGTKIQKKSGLLHHTEEGIFLNTNGEHRQITAEEIENINHVFEQLVPLDDGEANAYSINILSHFFTSYYDKPENLDLNQFLWYFDGEGMSSDNDKDKEAFAALKNIESFPFDEESIEKMFVPIRRISYDSVDKTFKTYMNTPLASIKNRKGVLYLEKFEDFYSYNSDFAAGFFNCRSGEVMGNLLKLNGDYSVLVIQEKEGRGFIVSHTKIEKKP